MAAASIRGVSPPEQRSNSCRLAPLVLAESIAWQDGGFWASDISGHNGVVTGVDIASGWWAGGEVGGAKKRMVKEGRAGRGGGGGVGG